MTRYRLTARAQMHGEVREPGYVFTLTDGQKGPHKAVPKPGGKSHDWIDHDPKNGIDANHVVGEYIDVPLYEEIKETEQ